MAININGNGSINGLSSISAPGISGVPVDSSYLLLLDLLVLVYSNLHFVFVLIVLETFVMYLVSFLP